tara:strand:- start:3 stop:317 length:315 start_codon:yes stop_codon:yes gene_type:complete
MIDQRYTDLINNLMKKNSKLQKEISDLTIEIVELKENFRKLHRLYTFGTPTDGLEVGSADDYETNNQLNLFDNNKQLNVFESPDGGKTIYQRKVGDDKRKKIND